MSLLSQTARYLLITAFTIALVGAVGFYTLIHRKIRYEVDEILTTQVKQTALRLQKYPLAQLTDWDNNPRIERVTFTKKPTFSDITILDSLDSNKPIPIRQLQETVSVNGQIYLVTIQQPYYEFSELTREISIGVILCFLILVAVSVVVGLGLSRRLWEPFYTTIDQLSSVRLDSGVEPVFPENTIREFGLLNRSLGELTQKLRRQFSLQKQFTENASHELQTPLAVASAELDFLMQSEHLTENDHAHLQRATDALGRLSHLNRSLLLLTQVENNQFASDELVNLSELVNQFTEEYTPFFQHKNMAVLQKIAPDVSLKMNRQLAVVLLTNLLKNAARHGGRKSDKTSSYIDIELTPKALTIQNTGEPLPFADNQLFHRFVKNPARPDSTGLGLALVKQICDRYHLPLMYQYDTNKGTHEFKIGLLQKRA
ncbi:sensor histidine kinase [Spirosoma radiotolerans]|uniref:histidine kinase n=1 Tax=Spirosoma radiotolerans TaxID=1379870 RepID=A0A0E3ZZD3_9BACT|nr:HAMP domain-containing sensor histidine kinase [Spirosoma radiotolerans]AKD57593.1 histidine kinase [Spirosoma radiotolerans]